MNTHSPHHPIGTRALIACAVGLVMLALPLGARAAAPAMPQEALRAAPAALPYGSGYERRQLALDERPLAAPIDASPTGKPLQGNATAQGTGTQGGSGSSGGRGHGRAR